MQSLIPFDFDSNLVRAVLRDGEAWFVANDVCNVLDLKNPRQVIERLDEDEKGVHIMDTLGGAQEMNIISESGLYALTFTSRKAEARRFRKWVTAELLPQLRRTGRYQLAAAMQAEPVIAANFDPQALTAAIGAVREARRLKGVAAALRLWATLGLPALDAAATDELGARLIDLLEGRTEISSRELAEALGTDPGDFVMRRQLAGRMGAMGWSTATVRRNGNVVRVWRLDLGQREG